MENVSSVPLPKKMDPEEYDLVILGGRRSEEFGIPKKGFSVDMSTVRDRKRRMVSSWNNVYLDNYKKSGAEFILGSGRFIGPVV